MKSAELKKKNLTSQPQTNALDLTFFDDYAYAQLGPVIQKRRLAHPAGVADLKRSAEELWSTSSYFPSCSSPRFLARSCSSPP